MAAVRLCLLLSASLVYGLRRQFYLEVPAFTAGTLVANIHIHGLHDASGLAASQNFPDVLYTHNDGDGAGPYIYALNASTGALISKIEIASAINQDWEDIAVGPCNMSSCIYIADTGKDKGPAANTVYRVKEPTDLSKPTQTLSIDSTANFTWLEDESDVIMVDPRGEVYLVGRIEGGRGMVSQLPASAWGSGTPANIDSTQFLPIKTEHHDPVAGDISRDGTEILIKSKDNIFYWSVGSGDILSALTEFPVEVPYHKAGIDEAICWSPDGRKYYTINESHHPELYVYSRIHDYSGHLVGK